MIRLIAGLLFVFVVSGLSGCGQTGPSSGMPSGSDLAAPESSSADGVFDAGVAASESSLPVAPAAAGLEKAATDPARGAVDERPFVPNSGRQSGLLTAGSVDDVADFSKYTAMLRNARGLSDLCHSLISPNHRQTMIRVSDLQGNPLGNARCIVRRGNGSQTNAVEFDLRTGTDGRTMLLTADHAQQSVQPEQYQLQVFVDGQEVCVVKDVRHPGSEWNLIVDAAGSATPAALDLALVIDTTGSMSDELEYLKTEIDSIVASVSHMFPDVDQRYALITYRDNGDEYVCRTFDFTCSLSELRRNLDAQSAAGGGDFPEAMDVALQSASQLTWRPGQTARVLFLVGDAPPHSERVPAALAAVDSLRQTGVRIFPVGASGVEKTAEIVMRTASLLTMGQYLFLTDHSGIGNPHATPDVSSFQVERLDRLMLRMIASELAGKRLAAQEVIAIERGEHFTCLPQQQHTLPSSTICWPPVSRPTVYELRATVQSSFLISGLQWLRSHGITVIVAVISGVIVFERLRA